MGHREGSTRPLRRTAAAALLAACLAGCGLPWDSDAPAPEPKRSTTFNTIAGLEPGERHVLTASVGAVLGDRAFVVHDVDLPAQGLLVLAPAATDLQEPDLVTADGVIRRFSFAAFRAPFGLADPAAYQPFEGRKVLVAAEVRSLA